MNSFPCMGQTPQQGTPDLKSILAGLQQGA
jgi:hypothetical protein